MAQSLLLSAMAVGGGYADRVVAMTSSHFAGSERQYRFPLGYGGQRTPTAQWTVTGSGAALVTAERSPIVIESATIDGANAVKVFFKVTLPLLMPIFVYCLITAMIGGIQMFDVPQVLSKGDGVPNGTTRTLVMYLNGYLKTRNLGMSGAISVVMFIITGGLGGIVYKMLSAPYKDGSRK